MEQEAPAQESAEQAPDENQIIDDIGKLFQRLAPEKQAMVLEGLSKLISGQGGVQSPEQGANGVPAGM